MRLLAISDLHLNHAANRAALDQMPAHPEDWLILAGDIGEKPGHLEECLSILTPRFARLLWLPGNHDLWASPGEGLRGLAKYQALVAIARSHGAVTPEDPYPIWPGPGGPVAICPLFLLYDYSLRPAGMPVSAVRDWAAQGRALCVDELLLDPAPYADRQSWCADRLATTAARLEALPAGMPTVLANHWPLHPALIWLPRIPRFTPWCGTLATQRWHRRFRAQALVSGHLHFRRHSVVDGVAAIEVSLGYPRQWNQARGIGAYLRQVLPLPEWHLPAPVDHADVIPTFRP